ncbi:MAG TPA: PAS domain S-box protein [Anaerolineae bacterium]|nr:PAS domain S-box protein [Anaerolineae bacterium]
MTVPRILIVEDNAIVGHHLQDTLLEMGYETCGILFSGQDAVGQALVLAPDLVLMDIKLQGEMDGVEAAGQIRAEYDIPVVYLTGHSDDATLQRAKGTEPFGYLLKPFDERELRSAIEMALYKHRMERRLRESERRYRILSELTSDYAYAARLEGDGRLLLDWASEAFLRFTGFEAGQAYSAGEWSALIAPEDLPLIKQQLIGLLSGHAQVAEHWLISREGEQRWVRHYARPVEELSPAGQIRICGAAQDITAEMLAREALQVAHDDLEARVQARTAELAAANRELQAEVAEHRQAEEALQRRNRDLALLNRVIAMTSNSEDMQQVFKAVCRELVVTLRASQAAVSLVEDRAAKARLVAEHHIRAVRAPLWGTVLPFHCGNLEPSGSVGDRLIVCDVGGASVPGLVSTLMRRSGTASLLSLPLVVEERQVGSLGLGYGRSHAFDQEEVSLLQTVAEQLSVALARARLAENQRRLSAAVEQAAGAVLITDPHGTIQYVNSAFERTTHYSRGEAIGQTPRILRSGEHDAAFYRGLWQTIKAGHVWQGRFVDLRKDGTPFYQEATITPVRDRKGEISNYVATMRDVTREVQLEQQFRHAQKLEALGRLAGSIAHDFRNMLTIIQVSAVLLEQQLPPGGAAAKDARRILRTAERAGDLVQQLLRFSRREVAESQVIDLNAVICEMDPMLKRLVQSKIELVTRFDWDLAPIEANLSQIEQVLMNLVVNARDAMPHGGELRIATANVTIEEACSDCFGEVQFGPHVLLAVSDTGAGMDERVKMHLFEPFFTTKPAGMGTGLGLAAVYGIVTQCGGHIRVDSRVGQGTTFEILFPASPSPVPVTAECEEERLVGATLSV